MAPLWLLRHNRLLAFRAFSCPQHGQELWLWHRVMLQLQALAEDARSQAKGLSEGSAARAGLSQLADMVSTLRAFAFAAAARAQHGCLHI